MTYLACMKNSDYHKKKTSITVPTDIAIDAADSVYVSDAGNNRIQVSAYTFGRMIHDYFYLLRVNAWKCIFSCFIVSTYNFRVS